MSNTKKYIVTGVTLGSIAAVAAGLIAVTNLITEKKIKQNEIDAVNKGINEIFESGVVSAEEVVNDLDNKYVTYCYKVDYRKNDLEMHGYAFRCEGSNMYGKISLLAGFDIASQSFMSMYLVKNEQTYASTLVEKYVNPVNSNEKNYETDVSCGATYGAKLVRDMINQAKNVAVSYWSK